MTTDTMLQNYRLQRAILPGDPYSVWRGDDATSGQSVIIQRLQLPSPPENSQVQALVWEFDILKKLDHPQLPTYLDLVDDGSQETWLVRETSEEQRVQAKLDRGQLLSPDELEDFLRQLLELLRYLHDQEVPLYHRDINPHTVTFAGDRYGFTDMGLLTALSTSNPPPSLVSHDDGYRAPERTNQDPSLSTDLYGLAAVALALITGMAPGELRDDAGHVDVHSYAAFDAPAVNLLATMLAADPDRRPSTAADALRQLDAPERPHPSALPLAAHPSQSTQPASPSRPELKPSSDLAHPPSIGEALEQYATSQTSGELAPYNAMPTRRSELRLVGDKLIIDVPGASSATHGLISAALIFASAIAITGFGCAFEFFWFCCLGFLLFIPGIPLAFIFGPRWLGGHSERLVCDAQGLRHYTNISLGDDSTDAEPRRFFDLDEINAIKAAAPPPNNLSSQGRGAGSLVMPGLHIRTSGGRSYTCAADISVRGGLPIGSRDSRELLWVSNVLDAHIQDLKNR